MSTAFAICLFCLASVSADAASPATPDVIPEGYHSVPVERSLDLSAFRETCCVQYVIQEGDTLSQLARSRLGSIDRLPELIELNEGVDPDRLQIGQRIWLPARQASAPRHFVYFESWPGYRSAPQPFALVDRVYARYGRFAFVIVGADHRQAFLDVDKWERVLAMQEEKQLEVVEGTSVRGLVSRESGIRSITEEILLRRDEQGRFSLDCRVQNLGGGGEPVDEEPEQARGDEPWFLLLGLVGAGLLWWRFRRRPSGVAVA